MIYPASDIINVYSFRESFLSESFKKFGEIPLWNPYMFAGQPFTNSETAIFYPPHILFLLIPPELAFGYLFALDVYLIGVFTYLFSKKIGLGNFGSFVSAITYMFSGTITLYIFPGHLSLLDSIIWLPLLLLLYEYYLLEKKLIYVVISGVVVGLMLLAGTTQIAIYSLSISFVYFLFRYLSIAHRKKILQNVRVFFIPILVIIIGISLAAIQLLPTIEFSKLSARSEGLSYYFASDFSLHPYNLITFLLPNFFGSPIVNNTYWGINGNFWSTCGYTGIFSIILALIGIAIKRNKFTLFFLTLIIFSLLFSFGRFGFVFPFFYNFVPVFNLFRVPARFLYIYGLSMAILAGIGADILGRIKLDSQAKIILRKFLFFIFTSLLLFTLIYILIFFRRIDLINIIKSRGYAIGNDLNAIIRLIQQDLIVITIFTFSIYLIILLKVRYIIKLRYIKLLIIIGIFADLCFFSIKFYGTNDPKKIFKNTAEINFLIKDASLFRLFDFDSTLYYLTGKNNIQSLTGIESLYLRDYRDFLWLSGSHSKTPYESFFVFSDINNLNILKLLNTKYIKSSKSLKIFNSSEIIKRQNDIYEITDTFPRSFIVPNAIVVKNKNELIKNLENKNFDFRNNILLEKKPNIPIKNSSLYKNVQITHYEPNKITLTAFMDNPGFLVLSEIYNPGWKAFVNGKETEIYKTNYALRSIYLNKGIKNVTFIFDPLSYKIGKLISISSFLLILSYFTYYIKHHKFKKTLILNIRSTIYQIKNM